MAKKITIKRTTNNKGRTAPLVPKAGFTATKRRYECGGKVKKG